MDVYKGDFDYDSDDDAILDNPESDYELDDLTDIDDARQTVASMRASDFSLEKSRSQATPNVGGATVSDFEVADGERRETADGNEEQK